jgi:hypothetical protein
MLWIKRNLFLAVGGLIALGLLGFGGYYFWTSYQENNAVEEKLKEAKADLSRLYGLVPFPSKTNIDRAKLELIRVKDAIKVTQASFSPLSYQRVKGQGFKSLLDTTIDALQKHAEQKGVILPVQIAGQITNRYAFSFAEQQKRLQFSEGSFPTITEQLAEIQAICTILFDAKINKLTGLRRGRVTTDDVPTANDYHELCPNRTLPSGAVVSPYLAEFNCFSSELAAVLEGFYKSPHGLIVKSLEVKPLEETPPGVPAPNAAAVPVSSNAPVPPPRRIPPPATNGLAPAVPGAPAVAPGTVRPPVTPRPPGTAPPKPGAAAAAPGSEILKTVLDEKLLKITLWVDVLKPPVK